MTSLKETLKEIKTEEYHQLSKKLLQKNKLPIMQESHIFLNLQKEQKILQEQLRKFVTTADRGFKKFYPKKILHFLS